MEPDKIANGKPGEVNSGLTENPALKELKLLEKRSSCFLICCVCLIVLIIGLSACILCSAKEVCSFFFLINFFIFILIDLTIHIKNRILSIRLSILNFKPGEIAIPSYEPKFKIWAIGAIFDFVFFLISKFGMVIKRVFLETSSANLGELNKFQANGDTYIVTMSSNQTVLQLSFLAFSLAIIGFVLLAVVKIVKDD
jgi:hypothetical protein